MSTDNPQYRTTTSSTTFVCPRCGLSAAPLAPDGSRRDHCPGCLHAQHRVDHAEGGPSGCLARMTPISIAVPRTGEWMLIHRCTGCDELTANPVREDDNKLILMRMAVGPLAQPPFPLEGFGAL